MLGFSLLESGIFSILFLPATLRQLPFSPWLSASATSAAEAVK